MEKKLSKREQNKSAKKEAFLEAARKLFLEKGFENTAVDEVVKAAGLTKRTLYQYFTSKEDLFYAAVLDGARLLSEAYEVELNREGTALEKIRLANEAYLGFYMEHNDLFRLLNYQPANQANCEESPHYREVATVSARRMMLLAGLTAQASQDGSILPTPDMRMAVFFPFFASFALLCTASASGKLMWEQVGVDEGEFLRFCFSMLARALRP